MHQKPHNAPKGSGLELAISLAACVLVGVAVAFAADGDIPGAMGCAAAVILLGVAFVRSLLRGLRSDCGMCRGRR